VLKSPIPSWEAPTDSVMAGNAPGELSGPWKLMLLGDGSPTRHLNLLTGDKVTIKLITMASEAKAGDRAPIEVKELKPPLLRRQVWIQCGQHTLAWAESWWNQSEAEHHLINKDQPIWESLTNGRSELFREVDGLSLVNADWLEAEFNTKGPFWSRHYRFFRQQKELTVIREVFNPKLEDWLGPISRKNIT
tara:strand:- start:19 stop:591 length:573 start_codon:yes stop_codon:yes gene_type:complete